MSQKRAKRVKRPQTDKPDRDSEYAVKSRRALEATHARHNPPVAGCGRCGPVHGPWLRDPEGA